MDHEEKEVAIAKGLEEKITNNYGLLGS